MDGYRFDDLAKAFAAARSRRGFVKGVLAGLGGAAFGLIGRDAVEADTCRATGRTCREGVNCCSGLCDKPAGARHRQCLPCPTGTVACDRSCRAPSDFLGDPANCGVCGHRCGLGNKCETTNCVAGQCVPVFCTSLDDCHDVGVCNPKTGVCSNPAKTDDSPCGNVNDCSFCKSGVCTPANPCVCDSCIDVSCPDYDPCDCDGLCS
jgi:hypothetical protein